MRRERKNRKVERQGEWPACLKRVRECKEKAGREREYEEREKDKEKAWTQKRARESERARASGQKKELE